MNNPLSVLRNHFTPIFRRVGNSRAFRDRNKKVGGKNEKSAKGFGNSILNMKNKSWMQKDI